MDEEPEARAEKKVDESWKDQVEREKDEMFEGSAPQAPPVDFSFFLSSLALEGYMALGEIPHPATHEKKINLDQAKYVIEVLGMLEEKTKGNLSAEESSTLAGVLYELRVKYVEKKGIS